MYIYIYTYICSYVYIYTYIHIYIYEATSMAHDSIFNLMYQCTECIVPPGSESTSPAEHEKGSSVGSGRASLQCGADNMYIYIYIIIHTFL